MSRPFQSVWLLHATVILAALASVPLTVAQLDGEDTPLMVAVDWVIWTIFVVDFLVMLTLARRRGEHLRRSWFSAALVILTFPAMPTLLQGLRIARVAQLLRLLRLVALVIMLTGIGLVSTIAGSVTAYFVSQEENAELRDIRNRLERIEQLVRAQHEQR